MIPNVSGAVDWLAIPTRLVGVDGGGPFRQKRNNEITMHQTEIRIHEHTLLSFGDDTVNELIASIKQDHIEATN